MKGRGKKPDAITRIQELRQSLLDDPSVGRYPDDPRWQEIDELVSLVEREKVSA